MAAIAVPLLAFLAVSGASFAIEGRAWGDIHVQTMDGATYDFQSSGEFVASRSAAGDFEVQLRLEPSGFPSHVSVATAVAVQVDSTRASLVVGREPVLYIDEEPSTLAADGVLDLPGGGRIERSPKRYEIYWSDGSILQIDMRKKFLNAFLRPAEARRSTLTGLFGNFNGIATDDVEASLANLGGDSSDAVRAGLTDLARMLFVDDEDPRQLEQEATLFQYEPGQSTYTFRKPPPTRPATPAGLSSARRNRAQQACRDAGVTDPDLLEACIVDVGYTRDESFAEVAASVQQRDDTNWDMELARR